MTETDKRAYIALDGVSAAEIQDAMTEDEIGQMNVRLHQELAETHNVPVEAVSLVVGERADALHETDQSE